MTERPICSTCQQVIFPNQELERVEGRAHHTACLHDQPGWQREEVPIEDPK